MNDDKKNAEEILPEDKKRELEEMPDHMKAPLADIESKKTVQDDANDKG